MFCSDLTSSVGGPLVFSVDYICLIVRENVWVRMGVQLRGQCESANEEKQQSCRGLPEAGQTRSHWGFRSAEAKAERS